MSDIQAIADRVEIEALRGEFTDAVMIRRLIHRMMISGHLRIHQHTTLQDVAVGTHRSL